MVGCVLYPYSLPLISKEDSGQKVAHVKVKADDTRQQKLKELKRMWRKRPHMWRKEQKTLDLHKWPLWI